MDERMKMLLNEAHAEFRRLRSGELGDNLRAQGVTYRIVWGVESYHLRNIAARLNDGLDDDARLALAEALWHEDVRESRMLAPRICPPEAMTRPMANEWAESVPYTELADQLCMHLLARTTFAPDLVHQWLTDTSRPMLLYMALQLALRLDIAVPCAGNIAHDTNLPMWVRSVANRMPA